MSLEEVLLIPHIRDAIYGDLTLRDLYSVAQVSPLALQSVRESSLESQVDLLYTANLPRTFVIDPPEEEGRLFAGPRLKSIRIPINDATRYLLTDWMQYIDHQSDHLIHLELVLAANGPAVKLRVYLYELCTRLALIRFTRVKSVRIQTTALSERIELSCFHRLHLDRIFPTCEDFYITTRDGKQEIQLITFCLTGSRGLTSWDTYYPAMRASYDELISRLAGSSPSVKRLHVNGNTFTVNN